MMTESDTRTQSVVAAFQDWMGELEAESELKETIRTRVKDLETASRELAAILQKIHHTSGFADLQGVAKQSDQFFQAKIRGLFVLLAEAVPAGQYYRYHNMFNFTISRLVYQASLTHYLKTETMLSFEDAAKALDVHSPQNMGSTKSDVFHLDLEDYLAGLIQMSNELSRFAVNSVTHGDYERPQRIAEFLNDINSGFRLLNLKNDMLRKKFDSLKYDMKKVEEVVYDLSIRGLTKKKAQKSDQEFTHRDGQENVGE